MGIIMTYAVNDRSSFNAMENWLKQIKTHAAENVVKVLVANKIDCEDRKVSADEGKQLASNFGVNYHEVSAKENCNITEMFMSIGKEIKDKILNGEMDAFISNRNITKNKVEAAKDGKKSSGCC
jgi:Ras-related protein Rab-8A